MRYKISKRHLDYLAVFVAVLGMGSLYFQVLRMPLMAAMELAISAIYILYNPHMGKQNIRKFLSITVAFLLTSVINHKNGFYLNDFIIWIVNIFFIAVLMQNLTFEEFKNKFTKIMIAEALVSLICFLWADVLGFRNLPFLHLEMGDSAGFYLTPYFTLGWTSYPAFHRNAGMFTEPGAHQIFLNFALLFLLASDDRMKLKRWQYAISVIILAVAAITTFSTTGYMCLAVVLLATTLKRTGMEKHTAVKITAIVIIAILAVIESQVGVVENKIAGISIGRGSGLTRYNDTLYGYIIALQSPIFGHGMYMTNQRLLMSQFGINNISNGMASFAIRAGVLITVLWMIAMYRGFRFRFNYGWAFNILVFILYFLCVNSEGLFLNLLFLSFIGYWKGDTLKEERTNKIGKTATT